MEDNAYIPHSIVIDEREKIRVSGVKDVISFDDETLLFNTVMGKITIKGENLHIESFDNDTGDLTAGGKIYAAVYMNEVKSSGGLLSRFFR